MLVNIQTSDRTLLDGSNGTQLRVAFVVHGFGIGGLERSVSYLINHLDPSRFATTVISFTPDREAYQWISREGTKFHSVCKKRGNDLGLVSRLARILLEERIDIVHSHNWCTLVETFLARRIAGVRRHIHAERGTVLDRGEVSKVWVALRAIAMRWAIKNASAVITNSVAVARKINDKCGFPSDQVVIIPNGIPIPHCANAEQSRLSVRQQLGISPTGTIVGTVGRLVPVKQFTMAVESVAALVRQNVDVNLVIVGDGPERDTLRQTAADHGISDRVHLVGPRTDVGNWLSSFDIYINTSSSEGMSQAIVEAMACGLPLVVTDVGDNAILAGGDLPCGLISPKCDTASFARSLRNLIQSPSLLSKFAANARNRHATMYGVETMVKRYENLYEKVAAKPK